MKHYLLSMFLFFTLISNAQVQRTFYGVPLGASIEQTKTLLSKQGVRFSQSDDNLGNPIINIPSVRIGGHIVDKAVMVFSKDAFYNIQFHKMFNYPYLSNGDDFFDNLHSDLSKKYSVLDKYEIDKGYSTTTILIYGLRNDKKTRIMLEFIRVPSNRSACLILVYFENNQDIEELIQLKIGGRNNEL